MTNETTASQPNSIGDDAQFSAGWIAAVTFIESRANDYLNEYATTEFDTGALVFCSNDHRLYFNDLTELAEDLRAALIKEESSRAPAAQASATIQAAPSDEDVAGICVSVRPDDYQDDNKHTDYLRYDGAVVRAYLKGVSAATIQEPVMVAEPVGVAKLRAALVAAKGLFDECSMTKGPIIAMVDAALAVPMVADPAGVALSDGEIIAICNRIDPRPFRDNDLLALNFARAIESAIAATVKDVPSEALKAIHGLIAVASAAYHLMDSTEESGPVGERVFKHQEDDNTYLSEALDQLDALPDDQPGYVMGPCAKAEWALRHILAAPLADKTGGGE